MEPTVHDPSAHASELEQAATKLEATAVLMDDASKLLNSRSEPCSECGVAHYDSFEEFMLARDLRASADKMRAKSRRLRSLATGEGREDSRAM